MGVISAVSWWETGSLGVTYLTAPSWVPAAFGLIGSERVAASKYRSELPKG